MTAFPITAYEEDPTARYLRFREAMDNVSQKDLDMACRYSGAAYDKMEAHGPFDRIREDAKTVIAMLRDYRNGLYGKVPWCSISMIVFSILYIINPLDLIPDFTPVIGMLDDAGLLGLCLKSVDQDLTRYKSWTRSFYYRHLKRKMSQKNRIAHHPNSALPHEGGISPGA